MNGRSVARTAIALGAMFAFSAMAQVQSVTVSKGYGYVQTGPVTVDYQGNVN